MKTILIFFSSLILITSIKAQNVGVGTVNPLMKLHVSSPDSASLLLENEQLLATGINNGMYFKIGNGVYPYTGAIKTIGQTDIEARLGLFTFAATSPNGLLERLSITDAGNVGIGTISPLKSLHVQQGGTSLLTSASGNGILLSTNNVSGTSAFIENLSGQFNQKTIALINKSVSGIGTTYFGSLADDGSTWINNHILSMNHVSGNVGIGLGSPTNKLSVNGDANFSGNVGIGTDIPLSPLQVGDFGTTIDNYITVKTQGGNIYKAGLGLYHYNDSVGWLLESNETDASFSLRHRNSLSGFNKQALIVDIYDNVGFGNYPTTKLDVNGSGWFRKDSGPLSLNAYQGVRVYFDSLINVGQLFAYDYENGGSKDLILQGPGGNLGIGAINPAAKLDVEGNIKITDGTEGAGKVLTSDANGLASWQDPINSTGNSPGQMQFWDGSEWLLVAPGQNNQTLTFCNGVPTWGPCPMGLSIVTTNIISNIVGNSAVCGGDVIYDGNDPPVSQRGVCWSTSPNPTTANSITSNGTGSGTFTSTLTGLSISTIYYVRAYAINNFGTAYGQEVIFTSSSTGIPYITSCCAVSITSNSANMRGYVSSENGSPITSRGVCYSTNPYPTLGNSVVYASGTLGSISVYASLSPGVTYNFRTFATNGYGTAYGGNVQFTTLTAPPTVATGGISGGGDFMNVPAIVTNNGGSPVGLRGICYSTTANPTVAGNHTQNGSGLGAFSATITGLSANTTYHIRAYAISGGNTGYSSDVVFTTAAASLPVLTTNSVTSILANQATCGGNVSSIGGSLLISRGVCWSTSPNPTTADNKTSDPVGQGIGLYTSTINNLAMNITYYVRAYAKNGVGTAYGPEQVFTTPLVVGYAYKGGKLAYILQPGDPGYVSGEMHGLIAATADQGSNVEWECWSINLPGAEGTAIGTGLQNSLDIIGACFQPDKAANICLAYSVVSEGITYNDWYLPSKGELAKLYLSRDAIGGFIYAEYYWSSTEMDSQNAFFQNFGNGYIIGFPKNEALRVRAIRAF